MEVKLSALLDSREALVKLNHTEGLDSVTAYRILKNINEVDKELKIYDEQRVKLLNTYCQKDDKGNPVIENGFFVLGDNSYIYRTELEKILCETVDVSLKKVSLESISKAGLSPAKIGSIEYMLETED